MTSPESTDTELHWCDATELARRIRERELSAVECLRHFWERIERLDAAIGAVVARDDAAAIARARAADAALAAGETWGPLHGVPMTIKESFDVAGLPTTFGLPMFANNLAAEDAAVVSRLRGAGAVLMAKTNVPAGLTDSQTYSEVYGTTHNPWDLGRGPGGSSGGESAALAAGLTPLGYGSDIGGSLRNPAHYTGTFSHKPTYGIVPSRGHSPVPTAAPIDLAVYGPMARSVRDLRLGLEVTMGGPPDLGGPWALQLPEPTRRASALRVAVWADDPRCPVTAETAERCRLTGRALEALGAEVSESARPDFDAVEADRCYRRLLGAALSVGQPPQLLARAKERARGFAADDDSREARRAWGAVMPHRDWLALNEQRTRLRLAWRAFFERWDVLVCPIARGPAFAHDARPFSERSLDVDGRPEPYFGQLFWAGLATASYLPATAVPTGPGQAGLPIGVQLIGAEGHDLTTLAVAEALEATPPGAHGGAFAFQPPPAYAS